MNPPKNDDRAKDEKLDRGRQAYLEEPKFDPDEGLDEQDKTDADSFPASDPPAR